MMRPKNLTASVTVMGVMAIMFCVPVVFSLSSGLNGLDTNSSTTPAASLATAGTFVLVIVGGVGGLWLGVAKGVTYLGDGRRASGPRGASGLRQASIVNAISPGLPLRSAAKESDQEERHPANHRHDAGDGHSIYGSVSAGFSELKGAKGGRSRGAKSAKNGHPKSSHKEGPKGSGSKHGGNHEKGHGMKNGAHSMVGHR